MTALTGRVRPWLAPWLLLAAVALLVLGYILGDVSVSGWREWKHNRTPPPCIDMQKTASKGALGQHNVYSPNAERVMRVCAYSTDQVVQLDGVEVRVWEAETADGVRCQLFVHRVKVHSSEDLTRFDAELQERPQPKEPDSFFEWLYGGGD